MRITSGEYDVYSSGTVMTFGRNSVKFYVAEDFILNFVFKEDTEDTDTKIFFNKTAEIEGDLVLTNFNNTLGEGLREPVKMGNIGDRVVYLIFRVFTLGSDLGNKTIHYTFYLGEEFRNGQ